MMGNNCRIGKVKFKSGGEINVLPTNNANFNRVCFGWGEVTLRSYDNKKNTIADQCYMLDAAKHVIMAGDDGDS